MADMMQPDRTINPVTPLGYDGADFHALGIDTNGVLYALVGKDDGNWLPLQVTPEGRLEVVAGFDATNFVPLRTDVNGSLQVNAGYAGANYGPLKATNIGGETYKVLANTPADRGLTWAGQQFIANLAAHVQTNRISYTIPAGSYGILNGACIWNNIPADNNAYAFMELNNYRYLTLMLDSSSPLWTSSVNVNCNWYLPTGSVLRFDTQSTCTGNVMFRGWIHIHIYPIT